MILIINYFNNGAETTTANIKLKMINIIAMTNQMATSLREGTAIVEDDQSVHGI